MSNETQENKTALVTGAFSGIGLATTLKLAQDGWFVYAAGRTLSKSAELVELARTLGVQVKPVAMDVTDESSIAAAIDVIAEERGRLDLLVNNAGGSFIGAVTDSGSQQIRQLFETNVVGVVNVTRLALRLMLRNHQGRVVNIGSALGKAAFPGAGVYAASKYAIEGLSDAMRLEFKLLGPDFHVILIEPGFIKTNFGEHSSVAEYGGPQITPYGADYLKRVEKGMQDGINNGPGPEAVANVVATAARVRKPKIRYVVATSAIMLVLLRRLLPDGAFDSIVMNLSGLGKYLAAQQQASRR